MEHLILKGVFPIEHEVEVNVWVFPKNRGTPKWMVYMENPIPMDDSGVPLFSETSIYIIDMYIRIFASMAVQVFYQTANIKGD